MDVEVAIIGAGAAGIGAARRLHDRGRRVLLIEAMDRIGGRAHTVLPEGVPLDLGCGWLHSAERNPLVQLAETQSVGIDRSEAAWGRQLRNLGFSVAEQREAHAAYAAFEQQLQGPLPRDDVAGGLIGREHRWRPYLDVLSGALNGAELDRVSASDLRAYDSHASELNWRVPTGMGALIAAAAASLPIQTGTCVHAVDGSGSRLRIDTDRGAIFATASIVTASTNVLARGAIRFSPGCDDQLHAAACLPLGCVEKLFIGMGQPDAVPPETHLLGNPHQAATGSYYLRPFGHPVIECFFGGIAARETARGEAAMFAFAQEELGRLLGTNFARSLRPLAASAWSREPTIGGAYSHALPGYAGQRAVLAQPVSERLCFAGEACSPHDFSTAHGAWISGLFAADHVDAALTSEPATTPPERF